MKTIFKVLMVSILAFSISACNDEDKEKAALAQQNAALQQQINNMNNQQQPLQQPAQPVIINNQQPPQHSGTGDFVTGMVAGHVVSSMLNNRNDRYYDSGSNRTVKNKTTIVNNNTYINNTQPVKRNVSSFGSTSTQKSTLSTSKPKSKYSSVFSRSKRR